MLTWFYCKVSALPTPEDHGMEKRNHWIGLAARKNRFAEMNQTFTKRASDSKTTSGKRWTRYYTNSLSFVYMLIKRIWITTKRLLLCLTWDVGLDVPICENKWQFELLDENQLKNAASTGLSDVNVILKCLTGLSSCG